MKPQNTMAIPSLAHAERRRQAAASMAKAAQLITDWQVENDVADAKTLTRRTTTCL